MSRSTCCAGDRVAKDPKRAFALKQMRPRAAMPTRCWRWAGFTCNGVGQPETSRKPRNGIVSLPGVGAKGDVQSWTDRLRRTGTSRMPCGGSPAPRKPVMCGLSIGSASYTGVAMGRARPETSQAIVLTGQQPEGRGGAEIVEVLDMKYIAQLSPGAEPPPRCCARCENTVLARCSRPRTRFRRRSLRKTLGYARSHHSPRSRSICCVADVCRRSRS